MKPTYEAVAAEIAETTASQPNHRVSDPVLARAVASFPTTYGLKAFSGTFRASPGRSFIDWVEVGDDGYRMTVFIVTEKLVDGEWFTFSRETYAGTVSQVVTTAPAERPEDHMFDTIITISNCNGCGKPTAHVTHSETYHARLARLANLYASALIERYDDPTFTVPVLSGSSNADDYLAWLQVIDVGYEPHVDYMGMCEVDLMTDIEDILEGC